MDKTEKTALIFSGGGSRGAYEVGVWRALLELGEQIDLVTGVSVGALNGALVAQGSFDAAEGLWRRIGLSQVFDLPLDETLPFSQRKRRALWLFGKAALTNGGAGTSTLHKLLTRYLDEPSVRNSAIDFGFVTVRFDGLRPQPRYLWREDIPCGRLADYLVASCALFPAIRAQKIDGKHYIDGGFADNLPIRMAMQRGATRLIAVHLEAPGMVHRLDGQNKYTLILIDSYWNLGELLLFDKDAARQNMRLGWLDTMRAYHVFDGRAYAFVRGVLRIAARRYYQHFYEQMELLGFRGIRYNLFSSAAYAALKNRVFRRGVPPSSALRGFALAGLESAGELFGVDPCIVYTLERFQARLAEQRSHAVLPREIAQKARAQPEKWLSLATELLVLREHRRLQVVFLALCIQTGLHQRRPLNLLPVAALLPDEFCAALYLVLSGLA